MAEFVYILTNPTIPDLVKIGRTGNLEQRMRVLSSQAGVPVPFECYYCCEVEEARNVEKRLHFGLGDHRINPKREFFRINPERVKRLLEGWAIRDVTPDDSALGSTKEEQDSLNRERSRQPVFTFSMVDIPIGSQLYFMRDESITATVTGDREIECKETRSSLSRTTLMILKEHFEIEWSSVRGSDHWIFENETLTERRIRLENSLNEY